MVEVIFKWLRKLYNKFVHGIAFLPAIMGLGFLFISIATTEMNIAGIDYN